MSDDPLRNDTPDVPIDSARRVFMQNVAVSAAALIVAACGRISDSSPSGAGSPPSGGGSSSPSISSVTPSSFLNAAAGIVIGGSNFGSHTGPAKVELGSSSNYGSATLVTQTVTSWGASSITVTVVEGALSTGTLYVFVTDSSGNVSSGLAVTLNAAGGDPYAQQAYQSGDLVFDPNAGSDGSGTLASPWNKLTKARIQSLSGTRLWCRQGSFPWPDVDAGGPIGTANARVQIASYPGEMITFTFTDGSQLPPPETPPGARLGGASYVDFHTVTLSCDNFGLALGETEKSSLGGSPSDNVRFIDCVGVRNSMSFTDNSAIIYVFSTACCPVQIIRGRYSGTGGGSNSSLLWFDYTQNVLILGALIDGGGCPIYFKHTDVNDSATPGGIVQNCIIRNAGRKFAAALNWVQYLNNVFDNCTLALDEDGGGLAGGNHCTLTRNTFLNSDITLDMTSGNVRGNNVLSNNVFAGTSTFQDNPFGANGNYDQGNVSDYSAVAGVGTGHFYRNGTNRTLAAHQAAFSGQEVHGVAGTITFVGGSTPGSTPSNWALANGSTGKNAASDGMDCGVDASKLLTVN